MKKKIVAIILCSFNGENYLKKQLKSIIDQSYPFIDIFISDDGSTDRTLEIIDKFITENKGSNIFMYSGPRNGYAKNFILTAIKVHNSKEREYSYYAFCDQDDIWHRDKIKNAVNKLNDYPIEKPLIFCSRTHYIGLNDEIIGTSPLFKKKPSFRNALVQSIAGGNTMLLNYHALETLNGINLNLNIVSHDWLLYLTVTANNGIVYYEKIPSVLYRQHKDNLIGSNNNLISIVKRVIYLLNGSFKEWTDSNIKHLQNTNLEAEVNDTLKYFQLTKSNNIVTRIKGLKKSGVYRQTLLGNISLFIAVIFKKL
jgi:glycosyltransferase involved in cell wall biosynthesis